MVAVTPNCLPDVDAVPGRGQQTMPGRSALNGELDACPHARQLNEGFSRLQFAPSLEDAFRDHYWQLNHQRRQVSLLIAMGLFIAFSIKDMVALPDAVWPMTAGIRLLLVVPALALVTLVAQRIERATAETLLAVAGMTALYGLAGAYLFAVQHQTALPYEGLLLVVMFLYFMFGLRWRPAMWINLPFIPIFVLLSIAVGVPGKVLVTQLLYLITANLIGVVGCYVLDHLARRGYLSESLAQYRAERDSMTQLFNHGAVLDRLDQLWARASTQRAGVAVLLIDLDYFKRLNDSQGHRAGDAVLMEIGRVLRDFTRNNLDMAGRYGGEEFVMLMYGASARQVEARAAAVRAAIEQLALPHLEAPAAVVTASIGAAYQRRVDGQDPGSLIDAADAALYRAKAAGRNRVETVCMDETSLDGLERKTSAMLPVGAL